MYSNMCTFVIGPSKSGKTTLCHAIDKSKFTINFNKRRGFKINIEGEVGENRQIGNFGDACTEEPMYYCEGKIVDFPGFGDNRGDEYNLTTLISLFNESQRNEFIRVAFCFAASFITEANGSNFLNLTNEIISLLNLSKKDLPGICLIITKSSKDCLGEIVRDSQYYFEGEKNFLIEAIKKTEIKELEIKEEELKGGEIEGVGSGGEEQKKQEIKEEEFKEEVLKEVEIKESLLTINIFECPENIEENIYKFNEENIDIVKNTLLNQEYINSLDLQKNIRCHIRALVQSISQNNDRSRTVFVSKLQRTDLGNISGEIVVIDKNIKLEAEEFIIKASKIIVLLKRNSQNSKKRKIIIKGRNPTVIFEGVKSVFDGLNLVIATTSSQKVEFPDPTEESFEKNEHFFRIESLCINRFREKYASYNNRYLDLIAYINPYLGSIHVDQKFNIKTETTHIELRLCLNEYKMDKEDIVKRFKSLKICVDVDNYLEGREENPRLKDILLHYAVNLPSIFQLLTKDWAKFGIKTEEIYDLGEIRDSLISNYLNLIGDYIQNNSLLETSHDLVDQALKNFLEEFKLSKKNYSGNKINIINQISKYLNEDNKKKILAFYNFYNILSTNQEKLNLFNYSITADISIYPNFLAAIDLHHSRIKTIDSYQENLRPNIVRRIIIRFFSWIFSDKLASGSKKSRYFIGQVSYSGHEFRMNCMIPHS